jgi:membrane protease YdiL (CAAX protease family)
VWVGVALVGGAIIYAALANLDPGQLTETIVGFAATGVGEELAFRGFIWERTRASGIGPVALVTSNAAIFAAWHLASVATGLNDSASLIGNLRFGLLFSVLRLTGGNVGLPVLVHMALT